MANRSKHTLRTFAAGLVLRTAMALADTPPGVIFVDCDARGANNGASWTDAFISLNSALHSATVGDEIWVAQGTYVPTGPDRTATFRLKTGVAVYGGFAGAEDPQTGWPTVIYQEDMEGDALLGDEWTVTDIAPGHTYRTTEFGPLEGDKHLVMISQTHGVFARNEAVLTVDLVGHENVTLRFQHREWDDETHPMPSTSFVIDESLEAPNADGVAISADGVTWHPLFTLESPNAYTEYTVNLDAAIAAAGISYTADFRILFLHYDNCAVDSDGFGLDMIQLLTVDRESCRDPKNHVTTLSGDRGVPGDVSDNAYHIVIADRVPGAVLDGFTITKGNANGPGHCIYGGGLCTVDVSPLIIRNCLFTENEGERGAAVSNTWGTPAFHNCAFVGNTADDSGGVMYNYCSRPVIDACKFIGNSSGDRAGAVRNYANNPFTIRNSIFRHNAADIGGAIANKEEAQPNLINCTFADNSATTRGGAIYNTSECDVTLRNSIVWDNTAPDHPQIYDQSDSHTHCYYSDIQGCNGSGNWADWSAGYDHGGNIDADPGFIAGYPDSLRLGPASPCIDTAGIADMPPNDIDGDSRPLGNAPDMGADEFRDLTNWDGAGDYRITVVPGWNMFSLPVQGFTVQIPAGANDYDLLYVDEAPLVGIADAIPLKAFWLNSREPESFEIRFENALPARTMDLVYAWNYFGVAAYMPTLPPVFTAPVWRYDIPSESWVLVTPLMPGESYCSWVEMGAADYPLDGTNGGDTDADGLLDLWETSYGCDPFLEDTDGDELSDADELSWATNPADSDTDGDTNPDGWELAHGLNPTFPHDADLDNDSDGLTNAQEYQNDTDPNDADSDGDNLTDLAELTMYMTDPLNSDSDGDTAPDGWEVQYSLDPNSQSDGGLDPDGDGMTNAMEYIYGRHPGAGVRQDTNNDLHLRVLTPLRDVE